MARVPEPLSGHRHLRVVTLGTLAAMPRVFQIARARVADRAYVHRPRARAGGSLAVVQVTRSGCGWWWPDGGGGPRPLPPGHALVFRTGHHGLGYGWRDGAPWDFVYAELAGDAALAVVDEVVAVRGHGLDLGGDGLLRLLAPFADRPGLNQAVWDATASARVAGEILAMLAPGPASGEDALVERAAAWMGARLEADIGIGDVARAVGTGREHLTRLFRARIGEPPAAWLRRRRLEQAALLLRSGDLPVVEVAARCGFRSASHFIKAYRARFATTPAHERRDRG